MDASSKKHLLEDLRYIQEMVEDLKVTAKALPETDGAYYTPALMQACKIEERITIVRKVLKAYQDEAQVE